MDMLDIALAGGGNLRALDLEPTDPLVRDDVCRFEIGGLRPGGRYRYRISSSAGEGSVSGNGSADGAGTASLEIDVSPLANGLLTIEVGSPANRKTRTTVGKIEPGGMLDDYLTRAAWVPEWHVVNLLQTFIDTGTLQGWLSKLDVVAFTAVDSAAGFVNFVNDDWTFTVTNSPVHEPYRGYRGNSTAGTKIATNYPLDGSQQYKLNDCHFAVYTLEGVAESTQYVGGSAFGSDTGRLGMRPFTGTALSVQINSISTANFSVSGPVGLSAADRIPTDVGNVHLGRDTVTAIRAQPATGYPPGNLNILTRGAGSDTATNGVVAYFSAGAGLTDSERAAEAAAVSQYLLGIGAIETIDTPEPNPAGPNYMTRAMNGALTFDVLHFTSGPTSDTQTEVNFNLFPLTHAISGSPAMATSTWTGGKVYFVWDDRADGGANTRPNPLSLGRNFRDSSGREARTRFSTIPRALASTRARIAWSLGYTLEWIVDNILAPVGLGSGDVLYVADMVAGGTSWIDSTFSTISNAQGAAFINETFVNYACTVDKILLCDWKLSTIDGDGVLLDAEAHDNRSTEQMAEHYEAIKALFDGASGRRRVFRTFFNPLNKPLRLANGLSAASLPRIHAAVDQLYIPVGLFNPEGTGRIADQVTNQVALLRGIDGASPIDYGKLGLFFQFGVYASTTSEQDALDAYTAITTLGMSGVICWPYSAKFGGDSSRLTVRKQHLLFFGVAAGSPIIIPGNTVIADFDAERDDLLTKDGSGVVTTMAEVVDGVALTQGTSSQRPVWSATGFNGRPGLAFAASSSRFLSLSGVPSTFPTGSVGCEIWAVVDVQVTLAAATIFSYGGSGGFTQRSLQIVTVGGLNVARATVGTGVSPVVSSTASNAYPLMGRHVVRGIFTATDVTVEIDGHAGPTVSAVPATGTGFARMGSTSGTTPASFPTLTVNRAVVTRSLTTDEADAFRLQLQQRLVS